MKTQLIAATVVVATLLVSVGAVAYYAEIVMAPRESARSVTGDRTVTSSTQYRVVETDVATQATQGNFTFTMHLEKAVYHKDEPITAWFNLTYIGKTPLNITLASMPFRLKIWNETHSVIGTLTIKLGAIWIQNLRYGQNITGKAVISDSRITYYDSYSKEPWVEGNVIALSAGSVYSFEGKADLSLEDRQEGLEITAPPLQILITK